MDNLISVIIPIYNTQEYLPQCLDSVINQTHKNLEIILLDDGSTDGSGKICDEYSKKDSRIIVAHQKNMGITKTRKKGISIARGNYIGFVDSDDWISKDMFSYLMEILLSKNVALVTVGAMFEYYNNSVQRYVSKEGVYGRNIKGEMNSSKNLFYTNLSGMNSITPYLWGKLATTTVWKKYYSNIPEELTIHEDSSFIYSCAPFLSSYYISNKPLYHYRIHQKSLMHTATNNYINSINCSYSYLKQCYAQHENKILLTGQLDKYYAAAMLKTITKLLDKDVMDNLIICNHFPLEALINKQKVVICGDEDIVKHYKMQMRTLENIEIVLADTQENINLHNITYDKIIVATTSKTMAENIKQVLVKNHNANESKIIWKMPKRISDVLIKQ